MTSTPALSIHDKLAQAQYEELLKARVLTQAKAVYHKDRFRDCTFDVIIRAFAFEGFDHAEDSMIIASLIVYPVANNSPDASWRPLLETLGSNIESVYKTLEDALRVKINTTQKRVATRDLEDADEILNECGGRRGLCYEMP